MADIKFSEFQKATISKDSDEIAILQDGVNKMIPSPILESKIINKTVSRVIQQGGASLNVINLKGVVPTYADLATITPTPQINDAYQVEAGGLVYVYTETGFQTEGNGFKVQPDVNGIVEEGNLNAVSGGEVYEAILNSVSGLVGKKDVESAFFNPIYTDNSYIAPAGNYGNDPLYKRTNLIPVIPNSTYSTNAQSRFLEFDENKVKKVGNATPIVDGKVVTGANTYFVEVYFLKSSTPFFVKDGSLFSSFASKSELDALKPTFIPTKEVETAFFAPTYVDGYILPTGTYSNDPLYKRTNKIPVSPNSTYVTNAQARFLEFDVDGNKKPGDATLIVDGKVITGAETYFVEIFALKTVDIRFVKEGSKFSPFASQAEVDAIKKRQDSEQQTGGDTKVESDLLTPYGIEQANAEIISGGLGQVGSKYKLPFNTKGVYKVQFEVQFPTDTHSVTENVVIAKAGNIANVTGFTHQGDFELVLNKIPAVPSETHPKIDFKSGLTLSFRTARPDLYGCLYFPEVPAKPFIGEDAFSIRYKGDITLPENQDVKLDVTNTGVRLYHATTGTDIISIPFPASKSIREFSETIVNDLALSTGSLYKDYIEFDSLSISEENTTDDIIRINGIKMVHDYGIDFGNDKGWNAFPFYATMIDKKFHKIEILFNKDLAGTRRTGRLCLDGLERETVAQSNTAPTTIDLKTNLEIGFAGGMVRNYLFEEGVTESSEPRVIVYMLHDIRGDFQAPPGIGTSVLRAQQLVDIHKRSGYTFVSIPQIQRWIDQGEPLPKKCWSIIQDDHAHLSIEITDPVVNRQRLKVRELFLSNGIKSCFGLIRKWITDSPESMEQRIKEINSDKAVFDFIIHDDEHVIGLGRQKWDTLKLTVPAAMINFRNMFGSINTWVYAFGSYDYNVIKVLKRNGLSTGYSTGGGINDAYGRLVTKAHYPQALPRVNADDSIPIAEIKKLLI